jgi:hypothetical protein
MARYTSFVPLLQTMFIKNKYTRWYYRIIDNAVERNSPKGRGFENHHIIPECFFVNRTTEEQRRIWQYLKENNVVWE